MYYRFLNLYLFSLFISSTLAQHQIEPISSDSLLIWSSDQYYLYEFYFLQNCSEKESKMKIKSINGSTVFKVCIDGKVYDGENICLNSKEKQLVQVFFKNISFKEKKDNIEILISNKKDTLNLSYQYKKLESKKISTKIFQSNFTNYLILNSRYTQIDEIVLFTPNREQFEHIQSKSRFLDLSFLEKGSYILEIENDEYWIHKK